MFFLKTIINMAEEMNLDYRYLSHIIDNNTPTYGNEYDISVKLLHAINKGAVANESHLSTTTHIGTHIDFPYHFFENGETIESYDASFWVFTHVLVIEINPLAEIINDELIKKIEECSNIQETDFIIVKTGIEKERGTQKFWAENPGFAPQLYDYFIEKFSKLRAFGFDSISLTSYKNPLIGREAHMSFLNPKRSLIVIEDMHLTHVKSTDSIVQIVVAPLRIAKCDGVPCTIIASIELNSRKGSL